MVDASLKDPTDVVVRLTASLLKPPPLKQSSDPDATIDGRPVVWMAEGVSHERAAGWRVPRLHARPVAGHGPAGVCPDWRPGPRGGRGADRVRASLRVLAESQADRQPRG